MATSCPWSRAWSTTWFHQLDRDPTVLRIVAQPLTLSWRGSEPGSHTPDLLTVHAGAAPTVWDVRALDKQDQQFETKSALTRRVCAVGRLGL